MRSLRSNNVTKRQGCSHRDDGDRLESVSPSSPQSVPALLSTFCIVAVLVWCPFVVVPAAPAAEVQLLDHGKWRTPPANTVDGVEGFSPSNVIRLSRYGGRTDRKVQATGFFRPEKIDGRWWLVDPEGHLFFSAGVCSVHTSQKDVEDTAFKTKDNWAAATSLLLRSHSFNTLGCWSDWQTFQGESRMPYTRHWNFMSTFGKELGVTEKAFGHTGYQNQCMPIFHPDFESFCDRHAKQLAETKDDPWLLGHFSDNELPLRPNLLDLYLSLPKDSHGYKAAKAWWDTHRADVGPQEQKPSENDQDAFLEYVATRYYTIVGAAIRRYDPNHLFLGSRVHGRCIRPATFRGSASVDVVSVNYYHRWDPELRRIAEWARAAGRPVLISEWYAMALPDANKEVSGAGFRVRSVRDRGLFYQNFTLGLLKSPDCVGWHWFKYSGDDDHAAKGIVDRDYHPHNEMLALMGALNQQMYPLLDFFDGAHGPRARAEQSPAGDVLKAAPEE
ncbi:MAG: hypothetical protein FJ276_23890 [Planctomycetes bacterium]|nr:hypothetical protein [Planctomycetota bacterium]